ncbi:MAG: hypothetical protein ACTHOR_06175 [Devosia sp.]|jgi:hypothetical protein
MKKLATLVAATSLALIAAVSTATPSSADPAGAAIAGGVLGFMAGAAAASGGGVYYDYPHPHYPRWRGEAWREHVAACEDDYGWRYNPRTDLVHLHGDVFPCDD